MTEFSLAHLTVPDISPNHAVLTAAKAGYQRIGLRLLPATPEEKPYPLLTDSKLLAETISSLQDNGILVGDVELIRLKPETTPEEFLIFFSVAQQLSAKQIIVVCDDPEKNRAIDNFAILCQYAQPFGLTLNLEPMPWTEIRDLTEAKIVIEQAQQSNAGILVDAFHFYRRSTPLLELDGIDSKLINIFQICDAPHSFINTPESIRNEARTARLVPGEGDLDLESLISRIPSSAVVSIEVPNSRLISTLPAFERSVLCLESTLKLYNRKRFAV